MNKILLGVALAFVAAPAMAHTGHGATDGLLHGLQHPILGVDHLLAMLAVGLWSGFVLPTRVWSGAAMFIAAMVVGGVLSLTGIAIPGVEYAILFSVLLFGMLVLVSKRGQARSLTMLSLGAIGFFASAHGYAHASEASGAIDQYFAGFLISTAGLHALGIAFARLVAGQPLAQRAIGGAIILSSLSLAVA
ncbi:HupE/UreJ family protein [Notoacmeibacter sp. MSK16QG-6]|uniref:HupE/UreJ family protein n=1 Tax=Notoacmeibacter sp. MSK16QG-6 TaxID=2957982 RepID=UPI00209D4545|nr:HupE/UreJ family protein [Notoacmeibacter sp. MSK16QG-6]MCP1198372.1 HupE/UreJ family protein [Notoacmeibacter sp. MSK16QG-6]